MKYVHFFHLDLVFFFFFFSPMISILAAFTLLFCCFVCPGRWRVWVLSKLRVVLYGEKLQLKGTFFIDSPHSGGEEAEVGNMISGGVATVTSKAHVSHQVWKCSYQMIVRIQEMLCPPEPAELMKWFTIWFHWAADRGSVLRYEFSLLEIKMGSWWSSDTLLTSAATKPSETKFTYMQ